jgi:hypothetical protein
MEIFKIHPVVYSFYSEFDVHVWIKYLHKLFSVNSILFQIFIYQRLTKIWFWNKQNQVFIRKSLV